MPDAQRPTPSSPWRALGMLWAAPNTLLGLIVVVASFARGGRAQIVDGVLEAHGPLPAWLLEHAIPIPGGALAITIGHVVLARSADALAITRDHERVHVRQYEQWGPLFIPAYLAASLIAAARGRHPYRDNRFERKAYGSDQ